MRLRAEMTVKEVEAPLGLFCRSGHTAPPVFQREPSKSAEPTKFFNVDSDNDPSVNGVYCEPCLIIVHALANHEKSKRR